MFIWAQLYGMTVDRAITKGKISVSGARKVSNTIGEFILQVLHPLEQIQLESAEDVVPTIDHQPKESLRSVLC